MSVGDDDRNKGDNGTERQQPSHRAAADQVQQQTYDRVDEPRHHQQPAPRCGVIQYQQAARMQ